MSKNSDADFGWIDKYFYTTTSANPQTGACEFDVKTISLYNLLVTLKGRVDDHQKLWLTIEADIIKSGVGSKDISDTQTSRAKLKVAKAIFQKLIQEFDAAGIAIEYKPRQNPASINIELNSANNLAIVEELTENAHHIQPDFDSFHVPPKSEIAYLSIKTMADYMGKLEREYEAHRLTPEALPLGNIKPVNLDTQFRNRMKKVTSHEFSDGIQDKLFEDLAGCFPAFSPESIESLVNDIVAEVKKMPIALNV